MKIVRFYYNDDIHFGFIRGGEIVVLGDGDVADEGSERVYAFSDVAVLAPTAPSKIVAVGLNYKDHAAELNMKIPEEPLLFMKPSTAVIGPDEEIALPPQSARVDYEGELAVIIGTEAKNVPKNKAKDYIFGYTCLNDVTARDLQAKDIQFTRAKSFDTFCPIGPWVETELDPKSLTIETKLNGKVVQSSSTKNMNWDVFELVSFISSSMTLLPGDIIATGTPPGIGPLSPGDVVEVIIEGIGTLKNSVVRA